MIPSILVVSNEGIFWYGTRAKGDSGHFGVLMTYMTLPILFVGLNGLDSIIQCKGIRGC